MQACKDDNANPLVGSALRLMDEFDPGNWPWPLELGKTRRTR